MKKKDNRYSDKHGSGIFLTVFWLVAGAVLVSSGYLASQANLTSMILGLVGGA